MSAPQKILVVDDDPQLRELLCRMLKDKGYAPLPAADGKAGLACLKKKGPVGALIDLNLPDMSGLEVLKEIKRLSFATECIVLTGHPSQDSAVEAVNLGAFSYVEKPCRMPRLPLTVRQALENREAARKTERLLHDIEERVKERTCLYGVSEASSTIPRRLPTSSHKTRGCVRSFSTPSPSPRPPSLC